MVGDDRQVAMALAIGDFVDPDPTQLFKARDVELLGDDVDHDLGDRLPADAQQGRDGGLVGALGQPGDD